METTVLLNDLLYIEEHLSCKNYMTNINSGFKYIEFKTETDRQQDCMNRNYLEFFLKGTFILSYNQFREREFHVGEMVLLPKSTSVKMKIEAGAQLLSLAFDLPQCSCDKLALQSLTKFTDKMNYDFKPTPICYPMSPFIEVLVHCLKNGMNCVHLHDIMQREFFFLLRGFYTKEQIAWLFHPIIGKELDFRDFIMQNYLKACNIDELVALSNMGRTSFFAKFKDEFGISVKQWMMKQMNERILGEVTEPGVSVKQLIDFCGFESPAHLNRYIKQYFGCTPKQLIQRYQP